MVINLYGGTDLGHRAAAGAALLGLLVGMGLAGRRVRRSHTPPPIRHTAASRPIPVRLPTRGVSAAVLRLEIHGLRAWPLEATDAWTASAQRRIGPQPARQAYSAADWRHLIYVAALVQRSRPGDVAAALSTFSVSPWDIPQKLRPLGWEASKALLVLRMAFAGLDHRGKGVSESVRWNFDANNGIAKYNFMTDEWGMSGKGGWSDADFSWPILWRHDVPALVGPLRGFAQGDFGWYDALDEYQLLRQHGRFRNLGSVKDAPSCPLSPPAITDGT